MLKFVIIVSLLTWSVRSQEETCKGQTTINYIYGNDLPPHGPPVQRAGKVLQGRPGKSGGPGPKGDKGRKGEAGVPDNRVVEALRSELREVRHQLEQHRLPRSCAEISSQAKDSGNYIISPNPGSVQPFTVFCDFSKTPIETVMNHDSMDEIRFSGCEPDLCYRRKIKYNASMRQIVAVIQASASCRQFIKLRCNNVLIHHSSGQTAARWISRTGVAGSYWGGATRPGYCACGQRGNCVDSTKKCNCDRNTTPETTDEGDLTDKNLLPVTELQFGDAGDANEYGFHTLGPLICSGTS